MTAGTDDAKPAPGRAEHADRPWVLLAASGLGAVTFAIVDRLTNGNAALLQKIATVLRTSVLPQLGQSPDEMLLALTGIALAGVGAAWLKLPSNRAEAFTRGFALLASLTVAAPFNPADPVHIGADNQISIPSTPAPGQTSGLAIASALADTAATPPPADGTAVPAPAGAHRSSAIFEFDFAGTDAVPPGTAIEILDVASGRRWNATLDRQGALTVSGPVGSYEMDVYAPGHRPVRVPFEIPDAPQRYRVPLEKHGWSSWLHALTAPDVIQPIPAGNN